MRRLAVASSRLAMLRHHAVSQSTSSFLFSPSISRPVCGEDKKKAGEPANVSSSPILQTGSPAPCAAASQAAPAAEGIEENECAEFNTVSVFGGKVRFLIKQIENFQSLKKSGSSAPTATASTPSLSQAIGDASSSEKVIAPPLSPILHPPPLRKKPARRRRNGSLQTEAQRIGSLVDSLQGGWVCLKCDTPTRSRLRTVCSVCRTVRPDIASVDFTDLWGRTWRCLACQETNLINRTCQCCGADPPRHSRNLAAKALPLGTPIVVNDTSAWWPCPDCSQFNRSQSIHCVKCKAFRYKLLGPSLRCQSCSGDILLSPEELSVEALSSKGWFVGFRCKICKSHAHGSVAQGKWLCACGSITNERGMTCRSCRIPKQFPSQSVKEWHFDTLSDWCCLSCFQANKACFITVGLVKGRKSRVYHTGDVACKNPQCGQHWHGESALGGSGWRCACGYVTMENPEQFPKSACRVCSRPYAIRNTTESISFWMRGDMLCCNCGMHLHRKTEVCFRCSTNQLDGSKQSAFEADESTRRGREGQVPTAVEPVKPEDG